MNNHQADHMHLSLQDLQQQFSQSLLYQTSDIATQLKNKAGFSAESLMQIHRNNFVISVTDSLRSTFNYTEQLVGYAFFDSVARQFILQQPPEENNICSYGARFPDYLLTLHQLETMPYIAEMAKFEWLYTQCQSLPMKEMSIDLQQLHTVCPDELGAIQFAIASNAVTFDSQQDIDSLLNMLKSGDVKEIDLNQPCYLLLQKQANFNIEITALTEPQWQLIQQLKQNVNLDALQPSHLQNELSHLLTLNLISGFTVKKESETS